jgi:DNA-binding HxlR family transcriptional regulator
MRTYGQFCPIARAAEILAERWTPIIIRNLLLGCTTFNAIADGAPRLSRGLLSTRLRELERAGVIEIRAKRDRHGSTYEPTEAGRELWKVLLALQHWGTTWVELTPQHAHPGVVLWAWATGYLRRDRLPDRRTLIRFDYPTLRGTLVERPGLTRHAINTVTYTFERGRWLVISDQGTEVSAPTSG